MVGPMIVPMKTIFPGDNPVILAQRDPPLNPVQNTPDSIFEDKMVVVNASIRGLERGIALPLLLDLARKPVFLRDNSVPHLETLLNPSRGAAAPHPFFVNDASARADVVAFLKGLGTKWATNAAKAPTPTPFRVEGLHRSPKITPGASLPSGSRLCFTARIWPTPSRP